MKDSPFDPSQPPAGPTPQQRRTTLIALMLVLLLSALDQTIVSTAMPRIVAEMKGLELYPWVTTIYLLSSTVMVPIWGKLADLYGRKSVMICGVSIFVVSSWLCGLSGEFGSLPILGGGMTQLIAFRGLQGIGGGALFTSSFAVLADLYPPRERGRYAGLIGSVFGLASVIGPVVGGFFTEHGSVDFGALHISGWRWNFYLNLPLSLLALFMIITGMPATSRRAKAKIDFSGAGLVIVAAGALMLALSWGGETYPWSSPTIVGLLGLSAASVIALLVVESKVSEPVLPLELFRIRAFWTNIVASFLLAMAFMGMITYMPLFLQLGLGVPATRSGVAILPLMFGLILTSTVAGRLVSRTGQYKPFMIGGSALILIGVILLALMGSHASVGQVSWRLFIIGLGLGPSQSLFSMVAQNSASPGQIGVVTSASQFFRQIGSTMGVAVFGALLTARLASEIARHGQPGAHEGLGQLQALALGGKSVGAGAVHVDPVVRAAFSAAMNSVFLAALVIVLLGLCAVIAIPHIPLRRTHLHAEPVAEPGEGTDDVEA